MADGIVPDVGKKLAASIIGAHGLGNVRLFQNAVTPGNGNVLGDFTEADFDGYAEVLATVDSYGVDTVNHFGWVKYAPCTFTKSAGSTPNTVYGWYVTIPDPNNGGTEDLFGVKAFSPELTFGIDGDTITIQPRIKFTLPP